MTELPKTTVDQSSDVFFKFSFIAGCEEFQKEFTAQAVDHSYDNVYEVVRKSVELYRANGSLHIHLKMWCH
jgi:hypothetical protein